MEAESLDSHLRAVRMKMEGCKSTYDMLDGMRRCFSRFTEHAEETHACPVCDRAFETPQQTEDFIKAVQEGGGEKKGYVAGGLWEFLGSFPVVSREFPGSFFVLKHHVMTEYWAAVD